MVDHVLVPMDDSPLARHALDFATTAHPGTDLTVLHVIDDVGRNHGIQLLVGRQAFRERAERESERLFDEVGDRTTDHDGRVTTETRFGHPSAEIVEYADEHDVDLIVMGRHGRSFVARALLGTVTGAVVRRSSVPVTVVG